LKKPQSAIQNQHYVDEGVTIGFQADPVKHFGSRRNTLTL
jgi:hypothetical protein